MIFDDWTLYPLLAEVDRKLNVVIGQLKRIATTEAIVMADIGNLKTQVDNLVDKVKAQTTIDASVADLVQDQVARLKELGDQIATLKADTVKQSCCGEKELNARPSPCAACSINGKPRNIINETSQSLP